MIIPVIDADRYSCPQPLNLPGPIQCLGLKCMAWRWADARKITGYCGMAGEPMFLSIHEEEKEE